MPTTLEEALDRIAELEAEIERLEAELAVYKSKNYGGRKVHDEAWTKSYNDFAIKYAGGMTLVEIVNEGNISRRTAYRYKAYYDRLKQISEQGDGRAREDYDADIR